MPGGALLVAAPEAAPGFAPTADRFAALGWLSRDEVGADAPTHWVTDVGRPLEILRPDEARAPGDFGASCVTACGSLGLGFDLYGDGSQCVPSIELCGSQGVTPPTDGVEEPIVNYCADCPAYFRSFRRSGDYCRSPQPGSTWRCAPDGEHLVCTAPGARPRL